MRRSGSLIFTIFLDLFVILFVVLSFTYEARVRMVPLLISIPTAILLSIVAVQEWLSRNFQVGEETGENQPGWPAVLRISLWIFAFSVLIFLVGFYLSILVFTFSFIFWEGELKWPWALIVSFVMFSCIYLFFHLLLKVVLWPGIVPKLVPDFLGGGILPPF